MSFAFLKVESAEALSQAGAFASSGGDALCIVDCLSGDEPDEGEEIEIWTVPGTELAVF